jgi:hypothetical protein
MGSNRHIRSQLRRGKGTATNELAHDSEASSISFCRRSGGALGSDRDDLEFGFAATKVKSAEPLFTNQQDSDSRRRADTSANAKGNSRNLRQTYGETATTTTGVLPVAIGPASQSLSERRHPFWVDNADPAKESPRPERTATGAALACEHTRSSLLQGATATWYDLKSVPPRESRTTIHR